MTDKLVSVALRSRSRSAAAGRFHRRLVSWPLSQPRAVGQQGRFKQARYVVHCPSGSTFRGAVGVRAAGSPSSFDTPSDRPRQGVSQGAGCPDVLVLPGWPAPCLHGGASVHRPGALHVVQPYGNIVSDAPRVVVRPPTRARGGRVTRDRRRIQVDPTGHMIIAPSDSGGGILVGRRPDYSS